MHWELGVCCWAERFRGVKGRRGEGCCGQQWIPSISVKLTHINNKKHISHRWMCWLPFAAHWFVHFINVTNCENKQHYKTDHLGLSVWTLRLWLISLFVFEQGMWPRTSHLSCLMPMAPPRYRRCSLWGAAIIGWLSNMFFCVKTLLWPLVPKTCGVAEIIAIFSVS